MLDTCPVLHLSTETERVLHWFQLTHDVQSDGFGSMRWIRTALPHAGGIGDQEAWLLDALTFTRQLSNRLLYENAQRDKRDRDTREWREKRRTERG